MPFTGPTAPHHEQPVALADAGLAVKAVDNASKRASTTMVARRIVNLLCIGVLSE
jgi:hypothetical protein